MLQGGEQHQPILHHVLERLPCIVSEPDPHHLEAIVEHFAVRDEFSPPIRMSALAAGDEDQWVIAD
jgi:hypothetical protein